MKSRWIAYLTLFLLCSILLTGCGPAATAESTASETAPLEEETQLAETEATPVETTEPTEAAVQEPEYLPCTIAFQSDRDGNWEIYRMAPDGSDQVNLTNNPADDMEPAFSPDGSQIAFVSDRVINEDEGGQFIYLMDADGNNVRQLPTENGSRHPAWTPTGEAILYDNGNDIFIINADGSEPSGQLTDTPEQDTWPDVSPDDNFVAWLSEEDGDVNIFVMDLRSQEIQQITSYGSVTDVHWTVDAEIFFHGKGELYGCDNCVVSADGSNVRNAGGKGSIQELMPFWTLDGDKVECIGADMGEGGDNEVFLVSDIYPGFFLNLTNTPGNDYGPSWPDQCGPGTESEPLASTAPEDAEFIIGYEGAGEDMTPNQESDLAQACSELPIACVQGDFDALIEQHVDAIITFSNRWHVMGSGPQIYDATGKGIPVIVLNAETDAFGAYNLSNDSDAIRSTLEWMFNTMNGTGDFIYFVFGQSALHQSAVDAVLAEYPGISATGLPAEYGDDSVTWESIDALIKSNPNLGAIWSDENVQELIIAAKGVQEEQPPYIVCDPKDDWLSAWQETMETNPLFQCVATINPGGTAYEGVYVAYYLLTGGEINPDALGGPFGNTLLYDYPVITNDNLVEWLGRLDEFRTAEGGIYELAPMTPEQIREAWFLN